MELGEDGVAGCVLEIGTCGKSTVMLMPDGFVCSARTRGSKDGVI